MIPSPPIQHFLFECLRRYAGLPGNPARYAPALNWKDAISVADQNRILPFVYKVIQKDALACPADLYRTMENLSRGYVVRALTKMHQYKKLSRLFTASKIPHLPLKGIALQQLHYSDGFRTMADIDVLIPRYALRESIRVFQQNGFRAIRTSNRWQADLVGRLLEARWNPYDRWTFYGPNYEVDLHWNRPTEFNEYQMSLDTDAIWAKEKSPLPSLALNALIVFLHTSRDPQRGLNWLDLMLVFPHIPPLETTPFLRADPAARRFLLGKYHFLQHAFYGSDVPEVVSEVFCLPPEEIHDESWKASALDHFRWIRAAPGRQKIKYMMGFLFRESRELS